MSWSVSRSRDPRHVDEHDRTRAHARDAPEEVSVGEPERVLVPRLVERERRSAGRFERGQVVLEQARVRATPLVSMSNTVDRWYTTSVDHRPRWAIASRANSAALRVEICVAGLRVTVDHALPGVVFAHSTGGLDHRDRVAQLWSDVRSAPSSSSDCNSSGVKRPTRSAMRGAASPDPRTAADPTSRHGAPRADRACHARGVERVRRVRIEEPAAEPTTSSMTMIAWSAASSTAA